MNFLNMLVLSGLQIKLHFIVVKNHKIVDTAISMLYGGEKTLDCTNKFTYICKSGTINIDRISIDSKHSTYVINHWINNNSWGFLNTKHSETEIAVLYTKLIPQQLLVGRTSTKKKFPPKNFAPNLNKI